MRAAGCVVAVALAACGAQAKSPAPTLTPAPTVTVGADAAVSQDEMLAAIQKAMNELAPDVMKAFWAFDKLAVAEGAIPVKYKELIAVAVAVTTQCPYCIRGHTEAAVKAGASEQELMEAIWVAAEMRAGAAYAHSILALDAMGHAHAKGGA